jgi:formylglycine-generating enzyme required for sulfatase activity
MFLTLKLKLILAAAAMAGPLAVPALLPPADVADRFGVVDEDLVTIAAGPLAYRQAGEFTRAGRPFAAPHETVRTTRFALMKRQVTAAEYGRCAAEGACPAPAADVAALPDRPMVKVSFRDAEAYARWLSRKTGDLYRLPTDIEWVAAAGTRFRDQALPDTASSDPSRRWIARYEQESERLPALPGPQPVGAYGANEHGVLDLAGNVWEWTTTCYRRTALDSGAVTENCGVRVAEGEHRAYMTDFIRDPRAGGCAVGKPPANLGFRLVREDGLWSRLPQIARFVR